MQFLTDPPHRPGLKPILARRIAQRIEARFSDPEFSIGSVVEELGYSRSQIIRVFKREFGKTPKEYLLSLRMSHAKQMIEERPYQEVMPIALEVGYENYEHFCREFRKKYGCPPSKWWPERQHR